MFIEMQTRIKCDACNGEGVIHPTDDYEHECPKCKGKGYIYKWIDLYDLKRELKWV